MKKQNDNSITKLEIPKYMIMDNGKWKIGRMGKGEK
jgi:hypothetical protein